MGRPCRARHLLVARDAEHDDGEHGPEDEAAAERHEGDLRPAERRVRRRRHVHPLDVHDAEALEQLLDLPRPRRHPAAQTHNNVFSARPCDAVLRSLLNRSTLRSSETHTEKEETQLTR